MSVIRNRNMVFSGGRGGLLAGTATFALLVPSLARAQPAPGAQPTGGRVSAGTASISQTPTTTTVTQTTQRAAVNWQSFDVGSQQRVTFAQPSSSSITLNRVTSGTPSEIAGRINANGQIAIVNQSGVVFHQGAQVNAAAVMVSASGISDRNFMAGRMVFDQPAKPDARVENRGTITVKQAGLAALVAPQVVNSGVINAKLGQVVLAGAQTATLDFYGDGLLSVDVTGQVAQMPTGPDGRRATALVTNSGIILAGGGTVQMTASAVDGVMQTLVQAGGYVSAGSVGGKTGQVVLSGIGGSISIEGNVSATGTATGTTGGRVQALASQAVTVASGAKIDVSGRAGGGTVALGTTLARAANTSLTGAPTASSTAVQKGATVIADATETGPGGRVALLASGTTSLDGAVSAQGGKKGGDGGFLEVSGGQVGLTGSVNLGAQRGQFGGILLDPQDLVISDASPAAGFISYTPPNTVPAVSAGDLNPNSLWIAPAALQTLTVGTISLAASRNLTVASPLTLTIPSQSLILTAGNNLAVASPISTPGSINLVGDGSVAVSAALFSSGTGNVSLSSGAGGLTLSAPVSTGGSIVLSGAGPITVTGPLASTGTGTILLNSGPGGLTLSAPVSTGGSIFLSGAGPITVTGPLASTGTGTVSLNSGAGALTINAPISSGRSIDLSESGTGGIQLAAPMTAPTVTMSSPVGPITQTAGVITTGALDVTAASATLNAANQVDALTFEVTNNFEFTNAKPLQIPTRNTTIDDEPATVDNTAGTLRVTTTAGGLNVTGATTVDGTASLISAVDLGIDAVLTVGRPLPAAPFLAASTPVAGPVAALTLNAVRDLTISSPINAGSASAGGIDFQAGRNLAIESVVTSAAGVLVQGGLTDASGVTTIGAPLTQTGVGPMLISAGPGGMAITAPIVATDGLTLLGDGPMTFAGTAGLDTGGGPLSVAPVSTGVGMLAGGTTAQGLSFSGLPVQGEIRPALVRLGAYPDPLNPTNILTTAGLLTIGGPVLRAGLTVTALDLRANGAVTQTAPLVGLAADGTLTGAAGSLTLTNAGNQITQFGPFATTGDLALSTASNLSIVGAVSARNIGLEVAAPGGLLSLQPGVSFERPTRGPGTLSVPARNRISMSADQVSFATGAGGALAPRIEAPFGTVEIAPFTGGRPIDLGSPAAAETGSAGHLVIGLADLATISPVTETLRIGQVTGATGPSGGPISVLGPLPLTATASNLTLDSGGAITQEAGAVVTVNTLSGQGASLLFDQANSVKTIDAFTTNGAFNFNDATNLTVGGPLAIGGAAELNVNGALTLAGVLTVPGTLQLTATASIQRTGGALTVGTLSGSAGADANFGSVALSTLGPFSVPNGTLTLIDDPPLTIAGPVIARFVDVTADGSLILAGNITGLGTGQSTLQVVRDPEGGTTSFVQTGLVTLAGAAGSAPIVRIILPDGTMTFANLTANGIALVLDAGKASIFGTMSAGALLVIGEGGSAVLRGSVAGDTTEAAATIARITPGLDPSYTFNGCEIGSALCGATDLPPFPHLTVEQLLLATRQPQILEPKVATPILLPYPAAPPQGRVTESGRRAPGGRLTGHDHLAPPRQLTDPDVVPPNISERDY